MIYLWLKSFHLLFVMAWVSAVFYLPRILVNLAELGPEPATQQRLTLMARRLYRFGHIMFGLSFLLGLALWQGWRLFPASLPNVEAGMHWIDAKLGLVALLLAFYVWTGRQAKRAALHGRLPSAGSLRLLNELPVLALLLIIYLALAKPF